MSALRWSRASIEIPEISVLTPGHSNAIHSLGCFASKTERINLQHSRIICPWLTLCFTLIYLGGVHNYHRHRQKQNLLILFAIKQKALNKPLWLRNLLHILMRTVAVWLSLRQNPESSRLPPDMEPHPHPHPHFFSTTSHF